MFIVIILSFPILAPPGASYFAPSGAKTWLTAELTGGRKLHERGVGQTARRRRSETRIRSLETRRRSSRQILLDGEDYELQEAGRIRQRESELSISNGRHSEWLCEI